MINKILNKNRNLVFLLLLLAFGAIGIGVMTLMETEGSFLSQTETEEENTNYKDLQAKVELFKNNSNWTKQNYLEVAAEINASADVKLITIITKGNLLATLNASIENKTYQKCESFLLSKSKISQSELNGLLTFVKNIGASASKITYYKTQLNKYVYYEKTFPSVIKSFVSSYGNYTESKFKQFKNQCIVMPGFDAKYKNQPKFRNLSAKMKKDLDKFEFDYYENKNSNSDKVQDK